MKHYWMTFCNDGVELFGTECATRAEAIKELKEAYRFDVEEMGHDPGFDYYIEEFSETDDEIRILDTQFFRLRMGKRGGVYCERTRAI